LAGWYARSSSWVAAAVDSLVGAVVDAGIEPQSSPPDHAVRERLQALWLRWTDHAAPGGLARFYVLRVMAERAMVESGEAFARLRAATDASTVPVHLELLKGEQVPLDLHREIGGRARIRPGIEFDAAGRRVAYRVCPPARATHSGLSAWTQSASPPPIACTCSSRMRGYRWSSE
jgi:capsid protein